MNLIQFESHIEQMEAHRRDFLKDWRPVRAMLYGLGATPRRVAMLEADAWKQWMKRARKI